MKLIFPKWLANTPCVVTLDAVGLSEDGEQIPALTWEGNVIYSEKARTVMTADKTLIRLEGSVIIEGDIAPDLGVISSGSIIVRGKRFTLYRAERPRNPDGSIHHTTLELM